MLRHKAVKTVNAPLKYCIECIRDPSKFLGYSKYTYLTKKLSDNRYEVVFRWVKWGIERFYKVRIEYTREDDTVIYRSTEDSPYFFVMIFKLRELEGGKTEITLDASMKAGLMADLLGRKDYREFIEELVEKGIVGMTRNLLSSLEQPSTSSDERLHCLDCVLYDESRRYCYVLRAVVGDTRNPPCRGKYYLSRELARGYLT